MTMAVTRGLGRLARLAVLPWSLVAGGSLAAAQPADDPRLEMARRATQQIETDRGSRQSLHTAIDNAPGTRVVGAGARRVPDGFFRETVAIHRHPGRGNWLCSGVLVAPEAVLTAGHCVCNLGLINLTPASGSDDGAITIGASADPNKATSRIDRAITYEPDFCRNGQKGVDLGLIFLRPGAGNAGKIDFQSVPRPSFDGTLKAAAARLVPSTLYLSSSVAAVTVVGFGVGNQSIGEKTYGVIPIVSRLCGSPLSRGLFGCRAGGEAVMAGWYADTCSGDSGGPAFVVVGSDYYLAAITSRAVDRQGRCGPGGIYTLITPAIVNWLRSQTGSGIVAYE